jgi:hypothetical protein
MSTNTEAEAVDTPLVPQMSLDYGPEAIEPTTDTEETDIEPIGIADVSPPVSDELEVSPLMLRHKFLQTTSRRSRLTSKSFRHLPLYPNGVSQVWPALS